MNNDLISVIIPIYNVKNYLDRCINSITNQTYKKLEIILVDDGSTDGSSEMCDIYKEKDNRIKVVHKKNGGLSDARNVGIDICKGNYITFVDSDDWLPLNSIETLFNSINHYNGDIACGSYIEINKNNNINIENKNSITKTYETEIALKNLMYMHFNSNSAWAKLYNKKLFNQIRYPVGKLYEDLGTTYKLFANSKKIVCTDEIVYYYYQNQNSIMHKKYSEKRLEGLDFAIEELNFINEKFPNIKNAAIYRIYYECMTILNEMPYSCKEKQYVKQYIKKYKKIVLHDNNLYKKQRLLCYVPLFGQVGIKFAFKIKNRS